MAKIELNDVKGGYNLSQINANFDKLEEHLNDRVLYRDNIGGEANQMKNDLDMNNYRVYNLPKPDLDHEAARWKDVKDLNSGGNKSLRVEDQDILPFPDAQQRANKLVTFDSQGQPVAKFPSDDSATQLRIDLDSAIGASLIGTNNEMTVERHLDILYYGQASVLDPRFAGGADPTGETDSTEAFNSAAQWPGVVLVPHGVFSISDAIQFNNSIALRGAGVGKSIILNTAATNCFEVGTGENNPHYVDISGFSFDYTDAQTIDVAAVTMRNAKRCKLESTSYSSNCGISIDLVGGPQQYQYYVDDFEINGSQVGIRYGHNSGGALQGVWVTQGEIYGCPLIGMIFHNISGSFINDVDVVRCKRGIVLSPDTGQRIIATWFTNVLADSSDGIGWLLEAKAGTAILENTFNACWSSSNGMVTNEAGWLFTGAGSIDGLQFIGGQVYDNYGHGIQIVTGNNYHFTGVSCTANSRAATNVYHGMYVNNVSSLTIIGGDFGIGGQFAPTHNTGIFIDTNVYSYFIDGVDATGNVTASINDAARRGRVNAIGYTNPNDRGVNAVPIGQTFILVTPGYRGGFSGAEIQITPRSDLSLTGATCYWVEPQDVLSFRVHLNAPATGAGFVFAWQIKQGT